MTPLPNLLGGLVRPTVNEARELCGRQRQINIRGAGDHPFGRWLVCFAPVEYWIGAEIKNILYHRGKGPSIGKPLAALDVTSVMHR
jgi:hypothetical protein